jgi:hypothetical protein
MASLITRSLCLSAATKVARPYHTSAALRLPYKDDQDRESLRPGSAEHTQSGRDDDVAANPDAAFNPSKTRPESAAATAGKDNETNPLNASGANQELNKPHGDQQRSETTSGAGKEINKGGRSGPGTAQNKNRRN